MGEPMSIKEQADFVEYLVKRCLTRDGTLAGEAFLQLSQEEAQSLAALGARLQRMAPHEDRIRHVVTGQ